MVHSPCARLHHQAALRTSGNHSNEKDHTLSVPVARVSRLLLLCDLPQAAAAASTSASVESALSRDASSFPSFRTTQQGRGERTTGGTPPCPFLSSLLPASCGSAREPIAAPRALAPVDRRRPLSLSCPLAAGRCWVAPPNGEGRQPPPHDAHGREGAAYARLDPLSSRLRVQLEGGRPAVLLPPHQPRGSGRKGQWGAEEGREGKRSSAKHNKGKRVQERQW
jgi:hypothetical protein